MIDFLVYDVFTSIPLTGNQLAVIPDATALNEEDLQKIAREFNFSETTFVYPPQDPGHTARVRIFTPTMEIPFAGHPTIGTAIALRDLGHTGDMVLELGVGPIPCSFEGDIASFVTHVPLETVGEPDMELMARCLSISAEAIETTTHAPIQAGVGLPFAMVELKDRETLSKCSPAIDAIKEGAARYPTGLDFAIFAYVRRENLIDARMFAPLDNIPEDPATGSACAALTALLHDLLKEPLSLKIRQGEDMGRPSVIIAEANGDPVGITISGQAVRTMAGELSI